MSKAPPTSVSELGTVLVTGASGFIGRQLCAVLQKAGVEVVGLSRQANAGPWSHYVQCDLSVTPLAYDFSGVDTVFHLAGRAHAVTDKLSDHNLYEREIVAATRHLVDSLVQSKVTRLVYVSSVKAMGEGNDTRQDESGDSVPSSSYGIAKREAEDVVLSLGTQKQIHCTVVRPVLVYGDGQKGNLAAMLSAVARRRFPPLLGIDNRRSMVHVADLVRALILCALHPMARGQIYIVTEPAAYSTTVIYQAMREALGMPSVRWGIPIWLLSGLAVLGDCLGRLTGRRVSFDSTAVSKLTSSAYYSGDKIGSMLDFSTQHTLADALPEMVSKLRSGRREVD